MNFTMVIWRLSSANFEFVSSLRPGDVFCSPRSLYSFYYVVSINHRVREMIVMRFFDVYTHRHCVMNTVRFFRVDKFDACGEAVQYILFARTTCT